MRDEELAKIHFILYLKAMLLNSKFSETLNECSTNQDDVIYTIDGIKSLLEREKEFLYFDDVVCKNILDYLSYARSLDNIKKDEIIDKINSIIISINNINSKRTSTDKYAYYEKQLEMRTGIRSSVDERYCIAIHDNLKSCMLYDYIYLNEILYCDIVHLDSNISCLFGSLNYYINYYEELCRDKSILNIIKYLNMTAVHVIDDLYKDGYTSTDVFKLTKKLSKVINKEVKEYGK